MNNLSLRLLISKREMIAHSYFLLHENYFELSTKRFSVGVGVGKLKLYYIPSQSRKNFRKLINLFTNISLLVRLRLITEYRQIKITTIYNYLFILKNYFGNVSIHY